MKLISRGGSKLVFGFGLSLKRLDQSFFCWKEHPHPLHLLLRFLQLMIVVSILFFSTKNMTQKQILHPSDRLPQPAVETLNFQQGRFLITKEELNFRIQTFLMDLERIREFARFAVANNNKLCEKNLIVVTLEYLVDLCRNF